MEYYFTYMDWVFALMDSVNAELRSPEYRGDSKRFELNFFVDEEQSRFGVTWYIGSRYMITMQKVSDENSQ